MRKNKMRDTGARESRAGLALRRAGSRASLALGLVTALACGKKSDADVPAPAPQASTPSAAATASASTTGDAAHYEQACNAGDPQACALLGQAHAVGAGVPKDEARAAALYAQAC
jgi:hypothetical protein